MWMGLYYIVCYVNKGKVVKTVQGDQNYQLSYVRVPEERLHKELTSLPLATLSAQPEDRLHKEQTSHK